MNRWSLRRAYAGTTLALLFLALSAGPARAHVDVQPRLLEQGKATEIRVELPSLRPGGPPDGLEIEGRGLELLSARKQANKGAETVWLVRLRAAGPTGNLPVVLRALYPDGRSVGVHAALTVVPPREEGSGFPWAGVVVGAGLAAALAAGVLLVARRKA